MGLFNIGRNSSDTLPEKEKLIQLISEIATILESGDAQSEVDAECNIITQDEYDSMQQTLSKENEELKSEIERLKSEIESLQNQNQDESSATEVDQPIEPVLTDDNGVITELTEIKERVTELARKETIVQDLHAELQKYKAGLKKDIITPMLKSIIRCYDRVIECRNTAISGTDESVDVILKQVAKEYTNLSLYISDMLYDYDIEIIEVAIGGIYEPKRHKAITTINTDDHSKHNTIAEVKKVGFEDVVLGRVLRHCEVVVYKLEK